MTRGFTRRTTAGTMLLMVLALPRAAGAQAYGSGPLTSTLTETEPTAGVFNLGRVKLAPGLTIGELGYDSNVFDEAEDPKEDWVFRGSPDVAIFSMVRFAKLSAHAASNLAYYKTYTSERSVGHDVGARLEMMLSRFRPFIGAGTTRDRTRPNGEIDVRADRRQDELSGGIAFELGPHSLVYGSAVRYRSEFENGTEEGIDLPTTLNHDRSAYSAGVRTDVTPITTLTVSGSLERDEFESLPLRNSENRTINAALRIGAEAAIAGVVTVGYSDTQPVDPLIERFRGFVGQAALTYSFLEIGRLSWTINRGFQYSFDEAEAYYKETTMLLSYTHRILGDVDAQVRGSKSLFDYGFRAGLPARRDTLDSVAGSVGYNLRNRTRISLNYEVARRRSPAFAQRNYDRTRAFITWLYAF